jgi:hypothetical protein
VIIDAHHHLVIGRDVADLGEFARRLTHDSQIRWLGPEKGVGRLRAEMDPRELAYYAFPGGAAWRSSM